MVMPRLNGADLDDAGYCAQIDALIQEGIGGFILFGGDIESTPQRLAEFQLRAETPLLIASDVERGLGQQLAGGTRFPGQRAVASAINPRSKKDAALLDRMLDAVRTETRSAGIHAVFSPVMDVNNNPDNPIICTRAFGDEPGVVEWFGSRYIRKLQKSRSTRDRLDLLACAKHFPGHGDTDLDPHLELPAVDHSRSRLDDVELRPFRMAIARGVASVMTSHILVRELDDAHPATLSRRLIEGLLRRELGFGGAIVTDDLAMGAVAKHWTPAQIAVLSAQAGCDLLELCKGHDAQVEAIEALIRACESAEIPFKEAEASEGRVRALKDRFLAGYVDPDPRRAREAAGRPAHRALAEAIAERSGIPV
jgi:beta-glucosidase-like glycosyl hydrolase